jgi:hypothetical protein
MPAIVFLATAFPEATADVFSADAAIAVLPVTVVKLPVELLVDEPPVTVALTPPGETAKAKLEAAAMEIANKILRIVIPSIFNVKTSKPSKELLGANSRTLRFCRYALATTP